jgi:hypothetical protein
LSRLKLSLIRLLLKIFLKKVGRLPFLSRAIYVNSATKVSLIAWFYVKSELPLQKVAVQTTRFTQKLPSNGGVAFFNVKRRLVSRPNKIRRREVLSLKD